MVVHIDSTYPDPKQAPTNLKHFKRIERKIEECRPLSNNVRGRQMVEFKRRSVQFFASRFFANPTRGISVQVTKSNLRVWGYFV